MMVSVGYRYTTIDKCVLLTEYQLPFGQSVDLQEVMVMRVIFIHNNLLQIARKRVIATTVAVAKTICVFVTLAKQAPIVKCQEVSIEYN